MREREPYLHHEMLMRRAEEAFLVAKIRAEQQRLGVAERDWVGSERTQVEEQEEEEEEEEKVGDEANGHFTEILANRQEATSGSQSAAVAPVEKPTLSAEEMQDQMDQFTHIMQQKLLSGEDHQHLDYSKIDDDETLDDHWLREANHDAEEKYFGED